MAMSKVNGEVTTSELREIIKLYRAGNSIRAIAYELARARSTIRFHLELARVYRAPARG
jgi:DNA-binding NarL/FixJ family response regulator